MDSRMRHASGDRLREPSRSAFATTARCTVPQMADLPKTSRSLTGTARRLAEIGAQRPRLSEWSLVIAGYTALAVLLTWPMALHPTGGVYGFGNDQFGGLWNAHWINHVYWSGGNEHLSRSLGYPDGFPFDERFIQPLDRLMAILFGGVNGGMLALNVQTFASFILAGATAYALGRYLSGSRYGGAIAGVVFTAAPFHVAMSLQYPSMATIQWCPLYLLALIATLRTRRLRDAALLGLTLALIWISSYYYGWFTIWITLTILAIVAIRELIVAVRARRAFQALSVGVRFTATRGAVALGAFGLVVIPLLLPLIRDVRSHPGQYARSASDVYQSNVKPWQYVLPPADNPLLGRLSRGFIEAHTGILPIYEQAVYIGIVPAIFAIIAFVWRRRTTSAARYSAAPLFAASLVAVALSFGTSVPRWPFQTQGWVDPASVAHVTNITTYLFDLSPVFRYYGRSFVYVSAALAGFSAVGFAILVPALRRRSRILPALGAAMAIALILADFANFPPSRWMPLPMEPWMSAVRALPAGPIVDYPVVGLYDPRSYYYMYAQTRLDHATINPEISPLGQDLALSVSDPNDPNAGRRLALAGVRYAVVHTHMPASTRPPYQPALVDDSVSGDAGASNPWFEQVNVVPGAIIYRVRTRPAELDAMSASYQSGFLGSEAFAGQTWRWIGSSTASVQVSVQGRLRTVLLSFNAISFDRDRRLTVRVDGHTVGTIAVPAQSPVPIYLPLFLGPGQHEVELTPSPGRQVVDAILHNGDPRSVSVRISTPTVNATHTGTTVSAERGFSEPEVAATRSWVWLTSRTGTQSIDVVGPTRRVTFAFRTYTVGPARTVVMLLDGQRIQSFRLVPHVIRAISFSRVLTARHHRLEFRVAPGPTSIDSALHNGDERVVSVRMTPLTVDAAAEPRVTYGDGFTRSENEPGPPARWQAAAIAHVKLFAPTTGRYLFRATLTSFARTRRAVISIDGRRVTSLQIPQDAGLPLYAPLHLRAGPHVLEIAQSPAAQVADSLLHNGDERSIGLRVADPELFVEALPPGARVASVAPQYGFSPPASTDPAGWRWIQGDLAELALAVVGPRRPIEVRFAAVSLARPRVVTVSVDNGPAQRFRIGTHAPALVHVKETLGSGEHRVSIRTLPGAQTVGPAPLSPFSREISVRISVPSVH